jgi:hypothetical protein
VSGNRWLTSGFLLPIALYLMRFRAS